MPNAPGGWHVMAGLDGCGPGLGGAGPGTLAGGFFRLAWASSAWYAVYALLAVTQACSAW